MSLVEMSWVETSSEHLSTYIILFILIGPNICQEHEREKAPRQIFDIYKLITLALKANNN